MVLEDESRINEMLPIVNNRCNIRKDQRQCYGSHINRELQNILGQTDKFSFTFADPKTTSLEFFENFDFL